MKNLFISIIVFWSFTSISYPQSSINFTANDINGEEIVFSSLLEKGPVMLAFWRSWCPSCKEEQKAMQELYEKYKSSGFEYIGVNVDNQKSVSKVKSYVAAHNFTFKVILDTDKKIFEMCGGIDEAMPYSLTVNKHGDIISTRIGFKSGDEHFIEEEIKVMLGIK